MRPTLPTAYRHTLPICPSRSTTRGIPGNRLDASDPSFTSSSTPLNPPPVLGNDSVAPASALASTSSGAKSE
jgi:hypothetical protein